MRWFNSHWHYCCRSDFLSPQPLYCCFLLTHSVYYHYPCAVFFTVLLIFQYLISKSIVKFFSIRFLTLSHILSSFLPLSFSLPPFLVFLLFSHRTAHTVHTEAAMLTMDQILASNELTMAATAAMPAMVRHMTCRLKPSLLYFVLFFLRCLVFSSVLCLIFCFRAFFSTLFFFFLKLLTLLTFYLLTYHTLHVFSLF
jgi:hypothetical protein